MDAVSHAHRRDMVMDMELEDHKKTTPASSNFHFTVAQLALQNLDFDKLRTVVPLGACSRGSCVPAYAFFAFFAFGGRLHLVAWIH